MAARQHDFPGTRNNLSMSPWQIALPRLVALAKLASPKTASSEARAIKFDVAF
jgi:hypothetical protein